MSQVGTLSFLVLGLDPRVSTKVGRRLPPGSKELESDVLVDVRLYFVSVPGKGHLG